MKFRATAGREARISSKFFRGMTVTATSVPATASKARRSSAKKSSPKISPGLSMWRMVSAPVFETETSFTSPSSTMNMASAGSPSEKIVAPSA